MSSQTSPLSYTLQSQIRIFNKPFVFPICFHFRTTNVILSSIRNPVLNRLFSSFYSLLYSELSMRFSYMFKSILFLKDSCFKVTNLSKVKIANHHLYLNRVRFPGSSFWLSSVLTHSFLFYSLDSRNALLVVFLNVYSNSLYELSSSFVTK